MVIYVSIITPFYDHTIEAASIYGLWRSQYITSFLFCFSFSYCYVFLSAQGLNRIFIMSYNGLIIYSIDKYIFTLLKLGTGILDV